jgi:hypothetical protein
VPGWWVDPAQCARFNIPFIYGETKDRLDVIRESQACVVSRVGDEGISLPRIERVIEVVFLYGSRMQESQRAGVKVQEVLEAIQVQKGGGDRSKAPEGARQVKNIKRNGF